jgi:hypothetical protein
VDLEGIVRRQSYGEACVRSGRDGCVQGRGG